MTKEIYISFDIECDGPCPGLHSLLSLGAVAFNAELPTGQQEIGAWQANFELLEEATTSDATTAFWLQHPHEYEATRKNTQHPKDAMESFRTWLQQLPGKKVGAAYPAGFDFPWVYYYSHRFLGESPLGFSCVDMKTYAMCVLAMGYTDSTKKNFPAPWHEGNGPHTHLAIDDAREQGNLFMKMLVARKRMSR